MATRSEKISLFAFDPARCDASSEVLAERWWGVGSALPSSTIPLCAKNGSEGQTAPLSFSPSQNGLNLVETLRGLAALSHMGAALSLSLHG
jgi:hypothetical protein